MKTIEQVKEYVKERIDTVDEYYDDCRTELTELLAWLESKDE